MISQCFDGLLLCVVTALSLSKLNPVYARQQVPKVPLGMGITSLPFSSHCQILEYIPFSQVSVFLHFSQEGQKAL